MRKFVFLSLFAFHFIAVSQASAAATALSFFRVKSASIGQYAFRAGNRESLYVEGTAQLASCGPMGNLCAQTISFVVEGVSYNMPVGSLQSLGMGWYSYNGNGVWFMINTNSGLWWLTSWQSPASFIFTPATDGITVMMTINGQSGTETVFPTITPVMDTDDDGNPVQIGGRYVYSAPTVRMNCFNVSDMRVTMLNGRFAEWKDHIVAAGTYNFKGCEKMIGLGTVAANIQFDGTSLSVPRGGFTPTGTAGVYTYLRQNTTENWRLQIDTRNGGWFAWVYSKSRNLASPSDGVSVKFTIGDQFGTQIVALANLGTNAGGATDYMYNRPANYLQCANPRL